MAVQLTTPGNFLALTRNVLPTGEKQRATCGEEFVKWCRKFGYIRCEQINTDFFSENLLNIHELICDVMHSATSRFLEISVRSGQLFARL